MIRRFMGLPLGAVLILVLAGFSVSLWGQALPTAAAHGSYLAIGAAGSDFQEPYGQQMNFGYSVFADANLTRRFGIEAEGRRLRFNTNEDTSSSTYLIGPRVSLARRRIRPYVKLLVGRGKFAFPFGDAHGSYFVFAPGGGLDISLLHGRAFFRVVDFQYQDWRDFTYGANRPYGVSTGISVRLF